MKYSIVICFFFAACATKNAHKESNEELPFTHSIPDFAHPSEDSILFWFAKGTTESDTSWAIIVQRKEGSLAARYTKLFYSPQNGEESNFSGARFKIKESAWDDFIRQTGISEYTPKDSSVYTGCFHCPQYKAFNGSAIIFGGKTDSRYLQQIDSILQRDILRGR